MKEKKKGKKIGMNEDGAIKEKITKRKEKTKKKK